MYDLVFIKIILVVPNPIPCWHNELKRTFRLGMSRINWILPATKWCSMLLTQFPLLGQVFLILSCNYYFRYQYYYSMGGIICSELEFPADKCEDFTNHLSLLIKRNLQVFHYTFISHTRSWTWASQVKARCTCHYTILNWLKCADHMLVYMKQVPHPCKKQLDWAPAETPAKIAGLGNSQNTLGKIAGLGTSRNYSIWVIGK